jgi:UDP-N-acetylmuramoyl-L-alanyl-D-glutamate--2,6-diaminopimelate ligase
MQTPIARLANDSRTVAPDACFFAIVGDQTDGHLFLDKAVQYGATAAICERPPAEPLPGLRALALVSDSRAAAAEAAATFFGRPSQALRLIGVTGTNGKTTVTYLLHSALEALGAQAGLMGTIEVRIGDQRREATHTTPDAIAVSELLAEMVEAGCEVCAMEVSSHALKQERVRAQRFAAGLFTNLTHEHLDYHGTFEAYARAKARLFEQLPDDAAAVLNRDDPAWELMSRNTRARVITFGAADAPAPRTSGEDFTYVIEKNSIGGLQLILDGASRRFRLAGGFNAVNIAASYATLRALGYRQAETLDALAEAPPVPGRLQTLSPADLDLDAPGPIAVIDYAHTPDALKNVLLTVREMLPEGGALHVVFGCGGNRDRAKRPIMGGLAADLADTVILTNDNPRTEDPGVILAEIEAGMPAPPSAVIPSRADAIATAVQNAGESDIVVIAGKGHETDQIVGTERRHFDDREVAETALRSRAALAGRT